MDCFVKVPATKLPPHGLEVPAFEIGQYVCSRGLGDRAVVTAEGVPWTGLSYFEAIEACRRAGYRLIRESQWLAVAYNARRQRANWTGDEVGQGQLRVGYLRRNYDEHALRGNSKPEVPERWLTLSNGERVCDLNGNVCQWVFDDVQGNKEGLVLDGPFEQSSPSLKTMGPAWWDNGGGMNRYPSQWLALVRSGAAGMSVGLYSLGLSLPDSGARWFGFRCVR